MNQSLNLSPSIQELETALNSFSLAERSQVLAVLVERVNAGSFPLPPQREAANMHCHTFYSYNAYSYSPTGLAWMAKSKGIPLLGIVDFDVLDGVDEFLQAALTVGVRASAAMETRVFVPEFATREINSPGEPGIYYYMGIGFTASQAPTDAAPILKDMRYRAEQRNLAMVERINSYLSPVTINYQSDVLPLTPAGNVTERHMLEAYTRAAASYFTDPTQFWAEKLKMPVEQVAAQIHNLPIFQNTVRSKLMKRGGIGYAQPGPDTFPGLDEVSRMIIACQALPCATWLDGTSAGEQAMPELLEVLIAHGVAALNIIPDRNWNIADPETRRLKVQNLYDVVELAQKFDLPLNIGTEMNTYGQKLVDDFNQHELTPLREAFLDGAYFIYGHTVMQRILGWGYQSEWAKAHFSGRQERNAFYTRVGKTIPNTAQSMDLLRQTPNSAAPDFFLK